jgi:hypothetical protein
MTKSECRALVRQAILEGQRKEQQAAIDVWEAVAVLAEAGTPSHAIARLAKGNAIALREIEVDKAGG